MMRLLFVGNANGKFYMQKRLTKCSLRFTQMRGWPKVEGVCRGRWTVL